jgi:hypothetical protein
MAGRGGSCSSLPAASSVARCTGTAQLLTVDVGFADNWRDAKP